MAAVDVAARPGALQAEQYDQAEADFWRDLDIPGPQKPALRAGDAQQTANMDEEIKITKKRKPIAKLDADRLLSERGIPELRRRATKRIKLGGKGNEYEDIGKLLQMYQMWLDDMFPKAKFRDGLAMVEKVGHSKRLNVMRREWIAATRPIVRDVEPEPESDYDPAPVDGHNDGHQPTDDEPQHESPAHNDLDTPAEPEEDDLEALLAQESIEPQRPAAIAKPPFQDDDDEDDLDALLNAVPTADPREGDSAPANDFADDQEAMNAMGMW